MIPSRSSNNRRGTAAVSMIIVLILLNLIIVGMVIGGARDHNLTIRRIETIQSFYAAEAGMNMAIRETITVTDEDGDGTVGSISDDANDANDPTFGQAQVVVTTVTVFPQTTLTSQGRSGNSRREIQAVME